MFTDCIDVQEQIMNSMERASYHSYRSHPSRSQVIRLLDLLEKNHFLISGFPRCSNYRERARKTWQKIAEELNNVKGCIKTWKQWTKYWADKKCAVKKKGVLKLKAKKKCGESAELDLSEIEERIWLIIAGEQLDTNNKQDELEDSLTDISSARLIAVITATSKNEEINQSTDCQDKPCSPSLLDVETVPKNKITTSKAEQPSVPSPATTVCSDDDETDGAGTESPDPIAQSPPCSPASFSSIASSSKSHLQKDPLCTRDQTLDGSARRHCTPPNTSPSTRVRERRRKAKLGIAQRTTQFARLTRQFLLLEEKRIEIDRRNLQIFERLVDRVDERERSTCHALQAIGEGLKLLAEALKNK